MFGHQHWKGIQADIVTCAKEIANGYMPLAATVVKQEIFEAFEGEPVDLSHFRHINTYGGHPVATAVGVRNLQIMEEEGLVDNARKLGVYLKNQLEEELLEHPNVDEIRGKGLLLGIEMVEDKETKTPLASAKTGAIVDGCKDEGVLIGRNGNTIPGLSNVLVMSPPLILSEAEADKIVSAIRKTLDNEFH